MPMPKQPMNWKYFDVRGASLDRHFRWMSLYSRCFLTDLQREPTRFELAVLKLEVLLYID